MSDIYLVVARKTASLQPDGTTFWGNQVLYTGTNRDDARAAYHSSAIEDFNRGPGGAARSTCCEVIKDANTEDFEDDIKGIEVFSE